MKKYSNHKPAHKNKDDHPEDKLNSKQQKAEEEKDEMIEISKKEYDTLKNKEQEVQDNLERMLRLQADFENARKRLERDKSEFIKFANKEIIAELLSFVDDFQRAFDAADKTNDFDVLHKGVEMILNRLLNLLKQNGISSIEAVGKPFDPAYHEAMMQEESDEHPENTVIEELQKGYLLDNRVLRTAKVKVSKNKDEQANDQNTASEQHNEEK